MRPPICAICHKDFRNDLNTGGSVQFKVSPKDSAYNEQMKAEKWVGHPKGLEWFCDKHLNIAQKYSQLTWKEARLKIIKNSKGWVKYWFLFQNIGR